MGNPIVKPYDLQQEYAKQAQQYGQASADVAAVQNQAAQQLAATIQQNQQDIESANAGADAKSQQAFSDFNAMLQGFESARQQEIARQEAANAKQTKQDQRLSQWGGIAEAAAALVNLLGTTDGAVSQQWASPQLEWAQRADTARRERDQKLENVRAQLENLQNQRAQLQMQYAQTQGSQARQDAQARAQASNQSAQVLSNGVMQAAQTMLQGQGQQAQMALNGTQAGVSQYNSDRNYGLSASTNSRQQQEQGLKNYMYGYIDPKTGKYVAPRATPEERKTYQDANRKSSGSSGSDNPTNPRTFTKINGDKVTLDITPGQWSDLEAQAKEVLQSRINNATGVEKTKLMNLKGDALDVELRKIMVEDENIRKQLESYGGKSLGGAPASAVGALTVPGMGGTPSLEQLAAAADSTNKK